MDDLLTALREHRKPQSGETVTATSTIAHVGDTPLRHGVRQQTVPGHAKALALVAPPPPPPAPEAAVAEPVLPADPEVESILAEVAVLAAKLPPNWRDAATNLCNDARHINAVEHAVMIRNCVAAFRVAAGPIPNRDAAPVPHPELSRPPPNPEYVKLLAEARSLATEPMYHRWIEREARWGEPEYLRRVIHGLRELARLRETHA